MMRHYCAGSCNSLQILNLAFIGSLQTIFLSRLSH